MAASQIEEKIIFKINIEYDDDYYVQGEKNIFYITMPKNYKNSTFSRRDFVIDKVKEKVKYFQVNNIFWTDSERNKMSIDVDQDFENALDALEAMDLSINTRKDRAQSATPIYKLEVSGIDTSGMRVG